MPMVPANRMFDDLLLLLVPVKVTKMAWLAAPMVTVGVAVAALRILRID